MQGQSASRSKKKGGGGPHRNADPSFGITGFMS